MNDGKKSAVGGNWIPRISLLIAAIGLFLTFLPVVYYRQVDQREEKIKFIDEKIQSLHVRQNELARIPRILVKLKTLLESGLPTSAFSEMTTVPAVVEIQNLGGDTAGDITFTIKSDTEVVSFETYDDNPQEKTILVRKDKQTISFRIDRLRKDRTISATLFQAELGKLSRSDNGIGKGIYVAYVKSEFERTYGYSITYDQARQISEPKIKSIAEIDYVVDLLENLRTNIRYESPWDSPWLLWPTVVVVGSAPYAALLFAARLFLRRRFQRVAKAIRSESITPGLNASEIENLLGKTWEAFAIQESEEFTRVWVYQPFRGLFGGGDLPGVAVMFGPDDKVSEIILLSQWKD